VYNVFPFVDGDEGFFKDALLFLLWSRSDFAVASNRKRFSSKTARANTLNAEEAFNPSSHVNTEKLFEAYRNASRYCWCHIIIIPDCPLAKIPTV